MKDNRKRYKIICPYCGKEQYACICGKKELEVVEVCPECLQRAAVDPEQIKRLKQISNVLSITAGTDTNIKECMESLLEIAEDLERSGTHGKEKDKEEETTV